MRIEAEDMSLSGGYVREKSRASSGGNVINISQGSATAATRFSGPAGDYTFKLAYHDENDGNARAFVRVDGKIVDDWRFNKQTNSTVATVGNLQERVISGIRLSANSLIEIVGFHNQNEPARIDYLDIISSGKASGGQPSSAQSPQPAATGNAQPASNDATARSTTGVGRIEAENMSLSGGFVRERSQVSSGGNVISINQGSATASTRFTGSEGTYSLKLGYYDESDGNSRGLVKINGRVVADWRFDEQTKSTTATTENFRQRVVSGVTLKQNDLIEVMGFHNQNELARFDFLEIAQGTTTAPPAQSPPASNNSGSNDNNGSSAVNSSIGVGKIEAENMSLSGGYVRERSGASSGGYVINIDQGSATAAIRFSGDSGRYDVEVAYHDESDGNSRALLRVNGRVLDDWRFDQNTGSTTANAGNLRKRVVSGIQLNRNDVIEVVGFHNQNEFARVDYLTVASAGSLSRGSETPTPVDTVNSTTGLGRIEAERMFLSGFAQESSGVSSGGQVINTQSTGTATTRYVGDGGRFDLAFAYHDENDGNSTALVKVDGKEVARWTFDDRTDSTVASSGNLRKRIVSGVQLNKNSVIEVTGTKRGNEFARFDYVEIGRPGSISVPTVPSSAGRKIRVLPLGDSNTKGEGTPGGYRIKFWERAVRDGVSVDFLGDRKNGPRSLGDQDHWGVGGWKISQMESWVKSGRLARLNPDVILFMMGTNDANSGLSGRQIRDRLSRFIDTVSRAVPGTHMFVSSIMPLDTPRGTASEAKAARDFNSLIPALVRQKASQGKRVSFVNAGGSLNVGDVNGDRSRTADQNDGLHATRAGYAKLGNAFYNGVSRSGVWKNLAKDAKISQVEADSAQDALIGDSRSNFFESGAGFDELTGNGGADAFTYRNLSAGLDRITDFDSDDKLRISASGFGGDLVARTALEAADYIVGSSPAAQNGGSTFLFNQSTQTLSFDVDGTGSRSAVGIATFANGYTPDASQIQLIA